MTVYDMIIKMKKKKKKTTCAWTRQEKQQTQTLASFSRDTEKWPQACNLWWHLAGSHQGEVDEEEVTGCSITSDKPV